jgi:hypothetical protein
LLQDLFSAGGVRQREITLRRADGTAVELLAEGQTASSENGERVFATIVFSDMTARLRSERARQESERWLRELAEHIARSHLRS